MTQHTHPVEPAGGRGGSGVAMGMIAATLMVLVVIVAIFLVVGGPGRFSGASSGPSQTNVNAPSQGQSPAQQQNPPQINVPSQVDINVNQTPQSVAPTQAPNR